MKPTNEAAENEALQAEVERLRNTSKQCWYPIACEYVSELEQERDQLKARLGHCQRFLASGVLYTYDELLRHDAEVIEQEIPVFMDPSTNNGDWRHDAEFRMGWNACRDALAQRAEQLRQQAKEVQT